MDWVIACLYDLTGEAPDPGALPAITWDLNSSPPASGPINFSCKAWIHHRHVDGREPYPAIFRGRRLFMKSAEISTVAFLVARHNDLIAPPPAVALTVFGEFRLRFFHLFACRNCRIIYFARPARDRQIFAIIKFS